ncbi:MAG: 3-deoxy-7-phosphoheptulonate synthase, partial [Nitrospirales bacterium]
MIIVLKPDATEAQTDHLLDRLRELGFKTHVSKGEERTIVGIIGDDR